MGAHGVLGDAEKVSHVGGTVAAGDVGQDLALAGRQVALIGEGAAHPVVIERPCQLARGVFPAIPCAVRFAEHAIVVCERGDEHVHEIGHGADQERRPHRIVLGNQLGEIGAHQHSHACHGAQGRPHNHRGELASPRDGGERRQGQKRHRRHDAVGNEEPQTEGHGPDGKAAQHDEDCRCHRQQHSVDRRQGETGPEPGQLDPYQSSMGGDYYYPCDSPADPLGSAASLWINADGKRYCNEGFGFMEWAAYAGALQPAGKIANVFDSNYEALIKAQPACHMGIDYPNGGMDGLPAILEAAVAGGPEGSGPDSNPVVYAANDYKTLGEYLGYEGEALDNFVASIERYNELCATGLDEDFGKEKSLMFAVNQPPYYAYAGEKTLGGMLCNTSGVAIDENGQVLARETFRPIPGLFAAGNTAGSRFGIQYTTALCGVSIAFAVTQGKFTGEYVASLV